MPYISQLDREALAPGDPPLTAGELTYLLTLQVERYRKRHGDDFGTFAEIVGVLEQTKDEFQRRVIHPYEDDKRELHGDVYAPLPSKGETDA